MSYRELLALYKSGALDEETRTRVASDIERQDAISEYLFDEQDIPVSETIEAQESGGDTETLLLIRKSIRRAFARMGLAAAVAVLVVIALCTFVLPGIVSAFFYNPNEVMGVSSYNDDLTTSRMELDIHVYSEMFLPCVLRDTVIAKPEGWGNYRITIPQTASHNGYFNTIEGYLSRGDLTLYNTDILRRPTANAFFYPDGGKASPMIIDSTTGQQLGAAGTPEQAFEAVEKLNDNQWYLGFISLKEITDYADFQKWFAALDPDTAGAWCSVYMEAEDGSVQGGNMGFSLLSAGPSMHWDEQAYPYLCTMGDTQNVDWANAKQVQMHFESMLRYLKDHPEILDMMPGDLHASPEAMAHRLKILARDGLRTCGFAILTQKDTLQQLAKEERVSYIYMAPAM